MQYQTGYKFAGRYLLKEFKGSGSFGEVWLAEDSETSMDVAIKIYIALDKQGVEAFKSEFAIAFELNHSNLLHINHFDICGMQPFLIMPYCPNGSASKLMGEISESETWKFIRDVSAGLAYLHSLVPPIIHQDIKPDNILIDRSGRYLITDFGISKRVRSSMRENTALNVAGSTAYMGPERFSANPQPVKASDVWSLGATIYEILMGELPFCGMGGGMQNHGAELPELSDRYSAELNNIVRACLATEPWNRPTAAQLENYAGAMFRGEKPAATWGKPAVDPRKTVVRSAAPPTGERNNNRQGTVFETGNDAEPESARKKSKLGLIIGGAAASVLCAVLLVFFLMGNNKENRQPPGEAEINLEAYIAKIASIETKIKQASPTQTGVLMMLIEIKALIEEVEEMESKHRAKLPNEYNKAGNLKTLFSNAVDAAYKPWKEAADMQSEFNEALALEYYGLLLQLKEDPDVRQKYNLLK